LEIFFFHQTVAGDAMPRPCVAAGQRRGVGTQRASKARMASLFVRRPNQHYQMIGIIVLFAMLVLMALALDGHKPLPGGY
jgi:hypothetical protein